MEFFQSFPWSSVGLVSPLFGANLHAVSRLCFPPLLFRLFHAPMQASQHASTALRGVLSGWGTKSGQTELPSPDHSSENSVAHSPHSSESSAEYSPGCESGDPDACQPRAFPMDEVGPFKLRWSQDGSRWLVFGFGHAQCRTKQIHVHTTSQRALANKFFVRTRCPTPIEHGLLLLQSASLFAVCSDETIVSDWPRRCHEREHIPPATTVTTVRTI